MMMMMRQTSMREAARSDVAYGLCPSDAFVALALCNDICSLVKIDC